MGYVLGSWHLYGEEGINPNYNNYVLELLRAYEQFRCIQFGHQKCM